MKKLLVLSLALALVLAFTLPAAALENVFGGYWRTRALHDQNFTGNTDDYTPSDDGITRVDTRTRLYYTAILNDNVKLVNKFEMDAVWGEQGGYGDFGADGISVEVKNTYLDANIGPVRAKVGAQGLTLARGFMFSDDYSGVELSFKIGDVLVPINWLKANEGGTQHNSLDEDMFALWPVFKLGENFTLNPYIFYAYSKDGGNVEISDFGANGVTLANIDDGAGVYWVGADADFKLGPAALWLTAIYAGGKAKSTVVDDYDVKAWLAAGGASVPVGPAELHGQAFYASGDDDDTDSDLEAFFGPGNGNGYSYYWSELMGYGVFDNQVSAGSPADKISNIWAINIGASISPIEKLKLTGDIWYASHVEDDFTTDEKKLGTEIDLRADYQLVEGLNLTVVGAYLFADDATSLDGNNSDDPYELGAQLSLSF